LRLVILEKFVCGINIIFCRWCSLSWLLALWFFNSDKTCLREKVVNLWAATERRHLADNGRLGIFQSGGHRVDR
jgi:hypothetical protein